MAVEPRWLTAGCDPAIARLLPHRPPNHELAFRMQAPLVLEFLDLPKSPIDGQAENVSHNSCPLSPLVLPFFLPCSFSPLFLFFCREGSPLSGLFLFYFFFSFSSLREVSFPSSLSFPLCPPPPLRTRCGDWPIIRLEFDIVSDCLQGYRF